MAAKALCTCFLLAVLMHGTVRAGSVKFVPMGDSSRNETGGQNATGSDDIGTGTSATGNITESDNANASEPSSGKEVKTITLTPLKNESEDKEKPVTEAPEGKPTNETKTDDTDKEKKEDKVLDFKSAGAKDTLRDKRSIRHIELHETVGRRFRRSTDIAANSSSSSNNTTENPINPTTTEETIWHKIKHFFAPHSDDKENTTVPQAPTNETNQTSRPHKHHKFTVSFDNSTESLNKTETNDESSKNSTITSLNSTETKNHNASDVKETNTIFTTTVIPDLNSTNTASTAGAENNKDNKTNITEEAKTKPLIGNDPTHSVTLESKNINVNDSKKPVGLVPKAEPSNDDKTAEDKIKVDNKDAKKPSTSNKDGKPVKKEDNAEEDVTKEEEDKPKVVAKAPNAKNAPKSKAPTTESSEDESEKSSQEEKNVKEDKDDE